MAYDEAVAKRVGRVLAKHGKIAEKKMFGGMAFMLRGHMGCGVLGDKLMIRVGPENYEEALSQPHVRKMDFTGRPLKGFIYVEPAGFSSDKDLKAWISKATHYVLSLAAR
jgi:TfoX/Sxy family transcriptional regulator of competence genes